MTGEAGNGVDDYRASFPPYSKTRQRSSCVIDLPRTHLRTTWHALIRTRADLSKQILNRSVGVAGHYSNRPELLEQLRKVAAILSDGGQDNGTGAKVTTECVIRSRRLRDRFSPEDAHTMIGLYLSGITAKQVAEKFGVSLSSVKRLLHQHGVHRRPRRIRQ